VGPSTQGTARKIVCVQGTEEDVEFRKEEVYLLTTVAVGTEVVTSTVSRKVAQPVWQVGHGPCVVVVVVLGQQESLGGTKSVVFSSRMHSGIGPHLRVGQPICASAMNIGPTCPSLPVAWAVSAVKVKHECGTVTTDSKAVGLT
jgi:hypothetical protein